MRIFETMKNFVFIVQKKFFFFVSKTLLTLTSSLIFSEKKNLKNCIFWLKAWVNPFGRMPFLRLWKVFVFIVKKSFLSIQNIIKPYFMFFFDRKQIKKKIACFDQKHGLIPLEKCFFETLNNFVFIDKKSLFCI